jgi:hypothetical protein
MTISLKILFFCWVSFSVAENQAAITYQFSCGRFGDNLLTYAHAKWLSCNLRIPLFYRPFQYSEQLMMHKLESGILFYKPEIIYLQDPTSIDPTKKALYVVPYFSAFAHERDPDSRWNDFTMDWEDPQFHEELYKMISPLKPITTTIPANHIAIAVHVRKYEGELLSDQDRKNIDPKQYVDYKQLLKFPPEQFYIEQLQSLINLFPENDLYIYIFSDENPTAIAQRFNGTIKHKRKIMWDHRGDLMVGDDNHVVEDFFFMTKFSILIRPQSNFSFIAARLAKPMIEIFPVAGYWSPQLEPIINKIQVIIRDEEKRSVLLNTVDLNKFVVTTKFRN